MTTSRTRKAVASVVEPTLPAIVAPALDFEGLRAAALVAAESPDTARAYAIERLAEFTAADAVVQAAGTRKSVLASLATFTAFKSGVLVEGKLPADAGSGVMDFEGWGKFFAETTGGTATSTASVRTWLRAGEAMVDWHLDPDSDAAYALLGGLAQSKVWSDTRKALKAKVAEDPDTVPTAEAIVTIVEAAEAKELARKASVTPRASSGASTPEPKSPLDRVKAALAGLSKDESRVVLTEALAWLDSDEDAEPAEGDAA